MKIVPALQSSLALPQGFVILLDTPQSVMAAHMKQQQ